LIGIPVTNLSVNPARSTGPALMVGGWAIDQLWLFWLAPIAGAMLAGLVYPAIAKGEVDKARGLISSATDVARALVPAVSRLVSIRYLNPKVQLNPELEPQSLPDK
jgi:hypothetical protein